MVLTISLLWWWLYPYCGDDNILTVAMIIPLLWWWWYPYCDDDNVLTLLYFYHGEDNILILWWWYPSWGDGAVLAMVLHMSWWWQCIFFVILSCLWWLWQVFMTTCSVRCSPHSWVIRQQQQHVEHHCQEYPPILPVHHFDVEFNPIFLEQHKPKTPS